MTDITGQKKVHWNPKKDRNFQGERSWEHWLTCGRAQKEVTSAAAQAGKKATDVLQGHIRSDRCWLETDFCWNPSGWRGPGHPDTKCPASILDMAWQARQCAGGWEHSGTALDKPEWRCHPAGQVLLPDAGISHGHFCQSTDMQVAPLWLQWPRTSNSPHLSTSLELLSDHMCGHSPALSW